MKKVLLASNNEGKKKRYIGLTKANALGVEFITPNELGLTEIDVVEDGKTLAESAEKKVRAYFGKTDLPILGNDTGFWLETEGFTHAPKRIALNGKREQDITKEEKKELMQAFWRNKATENGGKVDGAWVEAFALLLPDGTLKTAESRREIILTDTIFGDVHPDIPLRALYISKTTGKPAVEHTKQEELQEMQPIIDALKILLE